MEKNLILKEIPTPVEVKPEEKGCEIMPKMTNAQIITETQLCSAANLDSEAFHCGTDPITTMIQCKPK